MRDIGAELPWRELLIVAAIVAIAIGLRFPSIGARSFWSDEAYSAEIASHTSQEIVALSARDDAHPPFFYLALAFWGHVAGTDDAGLRSLSAVASVMTILVVWWLGRRLGRPALGLLAAFFTAASPFQILAAQEARMYALLGLLTVVSWAALLEAVDGHWRWWVVYGVATALAMYTHYFAFLNVLGQAVFVLGGAFRIVRPWALSQVIVTVVYLPWVMRFLSTLTAGRGWPFLRPPLEASTITALLGLLSFGGHIFGFAGWFGGGSASLTRQAAILAPFVGLATVGLVMIWRHPPLRWFVVGALIVPISAACAFSLRTNIISPRYFSFLHVPFAVLIAAGILGLASRIAPMRRELPTLVLSFLVVFAGVPVLYSLSFGPGFQVFDWRGAATWLSTTAGPRDFILITPAFGRVPFSRYFQGTQPVIGIDPVELGGPTPAQPPSNQAGREQMQAMIRWIATTSHDVLWIVTDAGVPQTALIRLATTLEGSYDLQGYANFNAIRIFKTKRHSSASESSRLAISQGSLSANSFHEVQARSNWRSSDRDSVRPRISDWSRLSDWITRAYRQDKRP